MAIAATATGLTINLASPASSMAFGSTSATAGQDIIVAVAIATTSVSVSSIVRSDGSGAGYTFTLLAAINISTSCRIELWQSHNIAASGSYHITVNFSGSTLATGSWNTYTGISGTATNVTTSTGTSFDPEGSIAMTYSGDWVVTAVAVASNSGDTFTADLGVNRQSLIPALTTASAGIFDNTSSPVSPSLRAGPLLSASRAWATASAELTYTSPTLLTVKASNVILPFSASTARNARAPSNSPAFVMARAAARPFEDEPTPEPRRVTLISPQPHPVFFRKQSDASDEIVNIDARRTLVVSHPPTPVFYRRQAGPVEPESLSATRPTFIVSHMPNPVLVRRPVVYEDSESMAQAKRASVFIPATIILPTPVFYRRQSEVAELEGPATINRTSVFLPPANVLPTPVLIYRTVHYPEEAAFLTIKRPVFASAPIPAPVINSIRNQYFFEEEI